MSLSDSMSGTLPAGSTDEWQDKKRHLWLIGLLMPSLPFIGVGLHQLTGWGVWLWIGSIVVFIIVPAIDLVVGLDRANPPDDMIEALENDRYYRWITYLFLPIQYVGFVGAFYLLAHPDVIGGLSTMDKIAMATTVGLIGGIGINTAHELGHKKEANERWLSKIALAQVAYGHFYIEHNRGHHVRVATPEDPASSRLGENFYQFWPRTVFGSLKSAWRLEKRRYARKKLHPFRLGNDVLNAWLMTAVLWGAMIAWLGLEIVPYLLLHAVVGLSLLEVVNYMEHYGMLRQKVGVGQRQRYERVLPSHSWNSNNIATNVLLYHLQRHSDHHANPTRRYQAPARLRGVAGASDRLRRNDHPGGRAGRMAPGDGSPRGGPLRRRRHLGQHQPAQACSLPRALSLARGRRASRSRGRHSRPAGDRGTRGPLPGLLLRL
jgi:alkane 1-monooxygenase